ncbi:hypothetical protein N7507_003631 [Penicillium longicatenatum]|nr:hypothetical protein N7507_003631 [Penicillium longicatenatum]
MAGVGGAGGERLYCKSAPDDCSPNLNLETFRSKKNSTNLMFPPNAARSAAEVKTVRLRIFVYRSHTQTD